MANIKTRDVIKGTIKQIDKASVITEHMRTATVVTKEKAESALEAQENSVSEYASNRVENVVEREANEVAQQFDKTGRKSVQNTKKNILKTNENINKLKEMRAEYSVNKQAHFFRVMRPNADISSSQEKDIVIKESLRSAGKKTIKTMQSANSIGTQKSVKTAKNSVKTAQQTTKATAKTTAKASQKAAQATKATAKAVANAVKATVKAAVAAIKAIITGTKALISAIIAGGWIAVVVIIVICLIAAIAGSFYGIFFSGEDSDNGYNIRSAITEINQEYDDEIAKIKSSTKYDQCEINGSQADWKDVLAIYSVKTTTDTANPMEVATIDDSKKAILSSVFWNMNKISSKTSTKTELKYVDKLDDKGKPIKVEQEVKTKILEISINSKSAAEMAEKYSFSETQKEYLIELISDKNNAMWNSLIYNLNPSGSGIDIGSLTFDNEQANDTQKKIVSVAVNSGKYGISAGSGYCEAWVADVYQAATGSSGHAHCAICAANSWGVSSDWSKIPVGATVYGHASSQFGHVGIYIGNGQVIHNLSGNVVTQSLESWINDFKGFTWGWENGKSLI